MGHIIRCTDDGSLVATRPGVPMNPLIAELFREKHAGHAWEETPLLPDEPES